MMVGVLPPVRASKILLVLITLFCCQYAVAKKRTPPNGIGYSYSTRRLGRPIPYGYLPFNASVAESEGWTKTSKTVDGLGVEYTHVAASVSASEDNSTETSITTSAQGPGPFLLYYTDGLLTAIRVTGPQSVDKNGAPIHIPGTVPSNISGGSSPLMDYIIKISSSTKEVTVGDIVLPPTYQDAEALGWDHGACMELMGGVHYLIPLPANASSNPIPKYIFSPIYEKYGPSGQLSALQLNFGVDNRTRFLEFDQGGINVPGTISCTISFCSVPECVDNAPKLLTAVHIYLTPLRVNKWTGVVKGARCQLASDAVCNAKRGRYYIRSVIEWLKSLGPGN